MRLCDSNSPPAPFGVQPPFLPTAVFFRQLRMMAALRRTPISVLSPYSWRGRPKRLDLQIVGVSCYLPAAPHESTHGQSTPVPLDSQDYILPAEKKHPAQS
jgi:hypothetical protein